MRGHQLGEKREREIVRLQKELESILLRMEEAVGNISGPIRQEKQRAEMLGEHRLGSSIPVYIS